MTDFDQAIALGPPRAEFLNNRGVLQARSGAWENALVDFDAALRICPDFAPAWANRAIVRARLDQVVKTTVFLTDLNDFAAMNTVYAEYFGALPPARSTVQVAALPKGASVMIEAIAHTGA